MSEPFVCYKGIVNTWECDEMGHMNVRFYLHKSLQGVDAFFHELGLDVMSPDYCLFAQDQHIRFLRELMPGTGIVVEVGVLAASAQEIQIYQVIRPTFEETISATVISNLQWRSRSEHTPKPFPEEVVQAAGQHMAVLPPGMGPRSIDMNTPMVQGNLQFARDIGMIHIGKGQVLKTEVNAFGQTMPDFNMGRISDGVVNFMGVIGGRGSKAAEDAGFGRIGGAALEYRFTSLGNLREGDLFEIYTGLQSVADKVLQVNHWVFNAITGEPVSIAEAVAISLDLETRKVVAFPPTLRAHIAQSVIPDLCTENV